MKVFVSWSGDDSRQAAILMKEWLPNVIQQVSVWVSSQDIGKGERWSGALWESLDEIQFGILMVTKTNCNAPWIMFEAGVLSKTVKARVIPVLCNLDSLEIVSSPLSQFQFASVTQQDIWDLILAVNGACKDALDEQRLKATFEKWWPDFESQFKAIKFLENGASKGTGAKDQSARLEKIEVALETIMRQMQRSEQRAEISNRRAMLPRLIRTPEGVFLRDEFGTLRRLPDGERPTPSAPTDLESANTDSKGSTS